MMAITYVCVYLFLLQYEFPINSCVCTRSKPTFLDAHEETFYTLGIHSSDTYINFGIISLKFIQYKNKTVNVDV